MEVVAQLNYRPNKIARSLSMREAIKIAFVIRSEPAFFWDEMEKGIRHAAKEFEDYGISVIIKKPEQFTMDSKGQIDCLEDLMNDNVKAVCLTPVNTISTKEKLNSYIARGVKIATINDDIKIDDKLFYIGPHLDEGARMAAEMMGKILCGQGNVAVINGNMESFSYAERAKSFREVIEERYCGIKIFESGKYDHILDISDNSRIITNLLESIPDLRGVYDLDGASLYEIGTMIKNSAKLKNIVLIGHEINAGVKELLKEDIICASICQDPYVEGYYAVKYLYEYFVENKKLDSKELYTRSSIVMRENMDARGHLIE